MLGHETDLFVIDTVSGEVYNLGASAGIKDIEALMQKKSGNHNARYYANRFVVISGIELGVDSLDKDGKGYTSIYNSNVIKKGSYFGSGY
jgi:hypothetical protein